MRTFKPIDVPDDAKRIPAVLRDVQAKVQEAANRADSVIGLTYLGVAPKRPEDGLYLSAAGVLGANRGLYRYDALSATYTFIA